MKAAFTKPMISEKSLNQASTGWYAFAVGEDARKEQIRKMISETYKVDVISIRTRSMHGKDHRVGKKMATIRRPDWKKAMVKLKAGQRIDVFETVMQSVAPQAKPEAAKTETKKLAPAKAAKKA